MKEDPSIARSVERGTLTRHNERHTALASQLGDEVAAFLQSQGYSATSYPSGGVEQIYVDNVTDSEWPEIQRLVQSQFDTNRGDWRFNKKYKDVGTAIGEPPMEGAVIQVLAATRTAQYEVVTEPGQGPWGWMAVYMIKAPDGSYVKREDGQTAMFQTEEAAWEWMQEQKLAVKKTATGPPFKIYWTNHDYMSSEEFNTVEEAVEYGKSKGFEFSVQDDEGIRATWSPIRGLDTSYSAKIARGAKLADRASLEQEILNWFGGMPNQNITNDQIFHEFNQRGYTDREIKEVLDDWNRQQMDSMDYPRFGQRTASYFGHEILPLMQQFQEENHDVDDRRAFVEWLRSLGENDAANYVDNLPVEEYENAKSYLGPNSDQEPLGWVEGEKEEEVEVPIKQAQLPLDTTIPQAWFTLMPGHEIKAVGRVTSQAPSLGEPVTLERAATGEQIQVDAGSLMPLSVAMQRVSEWDWTDPAKEDIQALGITGANRYGAQWDDYGPPQRQDLYPGYENVGGDPGAEIPDVHEVHMFADNTGVTAERMEDTGEGTGSLYYSSDVGEAELEQIAQAIMHNFPVYGDQVYVDAGAHRIDFEPDISTTYEDLYS
jgi:hypothetical protein